MASSSSINPNIPGMFSVNELVFKELISAPLSAVNRIGNTTVYTPVAPPSGKCRIFFGPQLNESASLMVIKLFAEMGKNAITSESFVFMFFNNLREGYGLSETDPLKCQFRYIQIRKEDMSSFQLMFSSIQDKISIAITKKTSTLVGPDGDGGRRGVVYIPEMPDTYVVDCTVPSEEWDIKIAEEMKKDGVICNEDSSDSKIDDSKSK